LVVGLLDIDKDVGMQLLYVCVNLLCCL